MKKFIALLAVSAFALAFVACGKKAETAETTVDSAATEEVYDSAAAPMDTVAADSAAH
jgi:hypothetical protein